MRKNIIEVINGTCIQPPPIWLMRQAGRYLPEYRKLRAEADSFLDLCYTPKLAKTITLQPIERFQLDAAILFSDILVIPDALGQKVYFKENVGPILKPMECADILALAKNYNQQKSLYYLNCIFETLENVRSSLEEKTCLLGFCGAPWTVACYMIAGGSCAEQTMARDFALQQPKVFQSLIDILIDISSAYLLQQLKAGADVVQIFDSWAGVFDEDEFNKWCIAPVQKIVAKVKKINPTAKIIGFPRGIGSFYENYQQQTKIDMLSLDWTVSMKMARRLQKQCPIQGCLDPRRLAVGGEALTKGVETILENLGSGPLVFNLGHGILPHTPVENVEKMIKLIRGA